MSKLFLGLGISIVVLVIIVAVILYMIYYYNPSLLNGTRDAKYPLQIQSDNLKETKSEFTLSFWYYIEGWKYKYNETKTLLNWDNGKLVVEFKPKENNMVVSMSDLDGNVQQCVIEDVKLQKWNFVCLTLWNRSLDIILDDKYSQSCAQGNCPDYSKSSHMDILGNDGFSGQISNIYFYNYARSIEDTIALYNKGPLLQEFLV